MRFDLVDLKLFSNVVEARSLTRGAEHSHISLAAASSRIKNLEEYIGVTLLSRSNQGVTMTSAGETLVAYARRVIRELEQLSGELQEFSSGLRGHIRLFANTTAMREYLPAVRSYLVNHPEITINMQERISGDIVRAVKDGVADIGIVAGDFRTADIEVIPCRRDRLVLAVALSHPLRRARPSCLCRTGEDLVGDNLLGVDWPSGVEDSENAFLRRGRPHGNLSQSTIDVPCCSPSFKKTTPGGSCLPHGLAPCE